MPDHRRTTLRRSPSSNTRVCVFAVAMLGSLALASHVFAQKPDVIEVEGQPLAANIQPVQQALDHLERAVAACIAGCSRCRRGRVQRVDTEESVMNTRIPRSKNSVANTPRGSVFIRALAVRLVAPDALDKCD